MKTYYSKSTGGFYLSEIHGNNIPEDVVEISRDLHIQLLDGQTKGKQIKADKNGYPMLVTVDETEDKSLTERLWRDGELARADIELYKAQDSDPKAVGTVAGWREYRKALRAWPEHKDFPDTSKRPEAPDAVVEDTKE